MAHTIRNPKQNFHAQCLMLAQVLGTQTTLNKFLGLCQTPRSRKALHALFIFSHRNQPDVLPAEESQKNLHRDQLSSYLHSLASIYRVHRMGCTVREKHVRPNRKTRSVKPEFDPCCLLDKVELSKSIIESGLKRMGFRQALEESGPNPSGHLNPSGNYEDNGWGYCTEEQLEEILLKNLEYLYNEAISKLVGLGFDEDVALKALLRNGHCYGGMDVLTNILHNSLAYLNSSTSDGSKGNMEDQTETVFTDLRQLEEYALAGMVYLLQQVKPQLSKGDAMWCLLMSDLHVSRASTMDIPASGNGSGNVAQNNVESVGSNNNGIGVMAPALCRFHGGWGFGHGGGSEFSVDGFSSYSAELTLQRDIECPKRFNLSPSMKSMMRRNVAAFAAGFRSNCKHIQMQSHTCVCDAMSCENVSPIGKCEDPHNSKAKEDLCALLEKFRDLSVEEKVDSGSEDLKDKLIKDLIKQIKDLEKQVKDRKDWAEQKALQAARKVSNELSELRMLRSEREDTQRLKKGKQTLEDSTMKRLSEMENALRKASGQVDKANAAVRKLENENAEIRAEMEASKLSAAESLNSCVEAVKKERKCLKKLMAWEKQKTKLQEDIATEKEKIKELQQTLARIAQNENANEAKWRQEQKAKEQAVAQMEDEQRSKEAAEASNKRKLETLRLKIEIDFQRYKDDLQRLEQELSRVKSSTASATELNLQSNYTLPSGKSDNSQGEAIARLLQELDKLDRSHEREANYDRECSICMKDEAAVVFLPCAHQVVCAGCNDSFVGNNKGGGKATCPCCRTPIQQRIRVFGATS